ncbi:tetratricopeptide repeat protein [Sorangium sp. So ce726]|uniref:CHAT domain-containing tetratricopeptide repeat protein n=1 Tax=Sorangium sp. So ce726 TaxID=3133319 RepID=UPI003F5DB39E
MKRFSKARTSRFAVAVGAEHPPIDAPPAMPEQDADVAASGPLDEAERLHRRVVELAQARRYDEAIALARRALELRESALGPEHPHVGESLNALASLLLAKAEYAAAEPLFRRALAIREKALGPEHPDVAQSLHNLAELLLAKAEYAAAEPLFRRALAIREKALGPDHPDVAQSLNSLAELLLAKAEYAAAEPLFRRALAIQEKALGPEHPDVAQSLNSLAALLVAKGDYAAAEPLYRRALNIEEKALGPENLHIADSLHNLAWLLQAKGDYAAAEPLFRRALAIREKALEPEYPDLATSLNSLARLLEAKGDYAAAEPLYRRALAIWEKALGPEHPHVADRVYNLARLLHAKGDYAAAEPLFRRALAIREKALGPEHPDVAESLNSLAALLVAKGDYTAAEPLYRRALGIEEKTLGPEHPHVAQSLHNLAGLLQEKGDYAAAEPLFRRALAIREKALGSEHPGVAQSLNSLAGLLRAKGDYVAAEPLYRRALAILEKALGPEYPDVAISFHNLAGLLQEKGDYAAAEPLYRRALAIRERVLGPNHPAVAQNLTSLARLLRAKGDYAEAEPLLRRALVVQEKALGPEHPAVAKSLNNLALLLQAKGGYVAAEPLLRRALAIQEKVLGPEHPDVAQSLNSLAGLLQAKGDYAAAEPLYHRALAIQEKALGPEHPDVAQSLNSLAGLLWANGAPTRALLLMQRATTIHEQVLASVLATSSERQKHAFAWTMEGETDMTVSLHIRALPDRADAARLALAVLLQRKGRVLDAMTDMLTQLRARGQPQDQAKLAELRSIRGELATRTLRGPAPGEDVNRHSDALAKLRTDAEILEQDLAARYKELAAERRAVTVETVQAALAPGAALVEIALFQPFDPHAKPGRRFGDLHYVACVLHQTGDPRWVELGPAAPIDALVADARAALSAAEPRYVDVVHALDEKVMQPVRPLLGKAREVYLSPDGELNLVPFAALVDERGQFLLARYRFTYLTSGRDLLRLEATQSESPRSSPLVIGNPAYDEGGGAAPVDASSERRSDAMGAMQFGPLRWTEPEAREVAKLFPNARLWLGQDATEAAVKALAGPSILHLATHCFFLAQARAVSHAPAESRTLVPVPEPGALPPLPENPLLRSGLALAGANLRHSAGEDGVLTALEVAGLDLWGTKLVVLSACETGVGTLYRGEGVNGLRRALVLAGAESQIMSLWKVADKETQALMTAYYGHVAADDGRSDALREVQITMASKGLHPYYWAAFIAGGSGRSLSGKEPPAVREAALPRVVDVDTVGAASEWTRAQGEEDSARVALFADATAFVQLKTEEQGAVR